MVRLRDRRRTVPMSVIQRERRVLKGATWTTAVFMLVWSVAISTDLWLYVEAPEGGIYLNKTRATFLSSRAGLWRICRTEIPSEHNKTEEVVENCQYHVMFPTLEDLEDDPETDSTILDYTRSEVAFSVISVILMMMAIGFSAYTFRQPRYMFKRVAACVHFLSAGTVLIVLEVLTSSVKYEMSYLQTRHPVGTSYHYGVSFYLGWITFGIYIVAGILFLYCSRKRKSDMAPTEELGIEDEPTILGR